MKATKDQIKTWLKMNGKDRQWLAEQLKTTKSTVDSWFSKRDFPSDRLDAISIMMQPKDSLVRVPFTDEQLRRTTEAAALTGNKGDLQAYCQKAIEAQVEIDLAKNSTITLVEKPNNDDEEHRRAN